MASVIVSRGFRDVCGFWGTSCSCFLTSCSRCPDIVPMFLPSKAT